jgi:hypothetical protein
MFNLKESESPIIKAINEVYHQSTIADLEAGYFQEFGSIRKWTIFSDYSLLNDKQNDVVTFSFLPYAQDIFQLGQLIKLLAPHEIKRARSISPVFVNFLKHGAFLTFSFLISDYQYLFYNNYQDFKASLLLSLDRIFETIPGWDLQNPDQKENNAKIAKKIQSIRRMLEQNKKHRVLKNLFLITTIGGFLATLVANRTDSELIGWFSDRDEILDVEKLFAVDMFSISFIQYLNQPRKCRFVAAPATSTSEEWYGELVKVPDYITGVLADYNLSTQMASHEKFSSMINGVFAGNRRNIFVYRLKFHPGKFMPTCSRLLFN